MKLAYLLAQYLYTNKRLDLPGIGTFLLDPSVSIDTESNKHHRSEIPEGITFECNPSIQHVPELITFISSKSGKMKVLAESDLESHLQMVQQFLNINKPFSFDGIGTLVKVKHGEFEFTQGNIINSKLKENPEKDKRAVTKKETVEAKYQAFLATPVVKSRWKKPVVVILILCGIGLAIWGGYTISTKQTENIEATLSDNNGDQITLVPDSSQLNKPDSTIIENIKKQPDNYKYVLEVCRAKRAFDRYKTLKDTKLASVVQLETKDSVQYKLFVLLPVSTDTTRAIDSLTEFLGRKVYIERQN